MKVAYFAESPADQAALTILTEAILGRKTEPVFHAGLRNRGGWPTVRNVLPPVLKQLHFHTDAEGIVFIVDSDESPPHLPSHEPPSEPDPVCRLCQLRRIAREALRQARPRSNQAPLKVALGLAVPAIEAWLLNSSQISEAAWINGIREGRAPYTRPNLKKLLYGTDRPSLDVEIKVMTIAASRLSENLANLETLFPQGFGALKAALEEW